MLLSADMLIELLFQCPKIDSWWKILVKNSGVLLITQTVVISVQTDPLKVMYFENLLVSEEKEEFGAN